MIKAPIIFCIFNRPRHVKKSLDAIRKHRPDKIYVVGDGPREFVDTDGDMVNQAREIIKTIDWPCEINTNYSDVNLGCRIRFETGMDWVFSHEDRAIIIEDDVVPNEDFFKFCDILLEKYKDQSNITSITGNNFQDGNIRGTSSYYFSKYSHIWGWATWSRAWKYYDPKLSFWPQWKLSKDWKNQALNSNERKYWEDIFNRINNNALESWDYSWNGSIWYRKGLTVTPNVNLATNVGMGPDGTHCIYKEDQEGIPTQSLGGLSHPDQIIQNKAADKYAFKFHFGGIQMGYWAFIKKVPKKIINRFRKFKNYCLNR